jgi:hypothetical protein
MRRKIELFRQLGDEFGVSFTLRATNPVLQMRHFEVELKIFAQLDEQTQKRHRIRSARNGDEHTIAARNETIAPNAVFYDFINTHRGISSLSISLTQINKELILSANGRTKLHAKLQM